MLLTSFIPEVKILEGFNMMSPKSSLNKNIPLSADIAGRAGFIEFLVSDLCMGLTEKYRSLPQTRAARA
jgi:hypothetical protein